MRKKLQKDRFTFSNSATNTSEDERAFYEEATRWILEVGVNAKPLSFEAIKVCFEIDDNAVKLNKKS